MSIKNRWEAARATLFGVPKEPSKVEVKSTSKLVLGAVEQNYGIYQIPSFRDQVTTFWNDPLLKEAVTMFSEQVVATGIYLTDNPEYQKDINGKKPINVIKEWCDENNLDTKLVEIAIELKAFGNSLWRIDSNLGFVKIPIEAVWHAVRIAPDVPLQERYNMQLMPIYGGGIIPWEEFIHFRIGATGYHAPFGQGVIYGLLAKPVDSTGVVCPSIYDIRLGMRSSLNEGFRKFSFGNELWCFENMSNEDFTAKDTNGESLADRIANMSSTGNRIATNVKGTIQLAIPERTESYDKFVQYMRDEFLMSLADPSLKLGLEQGFTKATSVTARDVYKYKVTTMRNTIKQHLEDLFKQILDKLGYDGLEAGIKLNFGPEEMAEYNIADIFAAFDRQLITQEESRHILSTYHKWDISGEGPEIAKLATPSNETKPTGKGNMPKQALKIPLSPSQTQQKISQSFAESSLVPQAPQTIIETVELPEGIAGYNVDFSIIYIDPLVQVECVKEGIDYDKVQQVIVAHEAFEYQALRAGRSWEESHRLATQYEKTVSKEIVLDWEKFNKMYLSLLPKVKDRHSVGPSDLVFQGKGIYGETTITEDGKGVKIAKFPNINIPPETPPVQKVDFNITLKQEASPPQKTEFTLKNEPLKVDIHTSSEPTVIDIRQPDVKEYKKDVQADIAELKEGLNKRMENLDKNISNVEIQTKNEIAGVEARIGNKLITKEDVKGELKEIEEIITDMDSAIAEVKKKQESENPELTKLQSEVTTLKTMVQETKNVGEKNNKERMKLIDEIKKQKEILEKKIKGEEVEEQ